jgi:electron transport complex protein RnfC
VSTTLAAPREGTGHFSRGIHPPENKHWSAKKRVCVLEDPDGVNVPLLQHIGADAQLAVRPNKPVEAGALLAEAEGFVSAPVHASIGGKVGRPGKVTLPNGRRADAVSITRDPELPSRGHALWSKLSASLWDPRAPLAWSQDEILEKIRLAGIVGMGGATFPTCVKLKPNPKKPVKRLLVNGCECEPYLTADARLMEEAAGAIITGALAAARACGAYRIDIAVEDNKPEAIAALKDAAAGTWVWIRKVETKYPMGGEKQMIRAVYDRVIPDGGLPADVGVAVINVSTAAAIAMAVIHDEPLTHRIVTVTGPGINEPRNLFTPVGTSFRHLIDVCGGLKPETRRVISGGPMMGFTVPTLDVTVTKGVSGILALTEPETSKTETACLRCGRCADACPLNLIPARMVQSTRHRRFDLAQKSHILTCMECGCCAYACPAGIPMVQWIRAGKAGVRALAPPKGGR